jgi:3-deoxy-D-arabino-heptulosonate 7-phosphate (DAHP) synthase
MIIAGPCSFVTLSDKKQIIETANALKKLITHFRVKIYLGGTRADRYYEGVGKKGLHTLSYIQDNIMPVGTEIQIPQHVAECSELNYLWVGARSSRNYALLQSLCTLYKGEIMLKRGMDMTIQETIDLYDLIVGRYNRYPYIIERGTVNIDRDQESRWSPDLKGVIRIKNERPDIFDRLVIDCSHSVGRKEYVRDTYKAFKAIDCKHYMFEATIDGKSLTDQRQMLSVKELEEIICK